MKPVHLSSGEKWEAPVIQISEDNHRERPGFYRAFQAPDKDSNYGVPLVGYCSSGGSFRTIKAAARDARKREPDAKIYRNVREIKI